MKALTYPSYGPVERLQWTDVPPPKPGDGEILVRVARAALNPKDIVFQRGRYKLLSGRRFPKRSGVDFSGVVEESRSRHFSAGQRVFGMLDELTYRRGTLAEYVACKEREAAVLPEGVSDESGAAVALVASTALQALRDVARAKPGSRVLLHGASGGVGTVAIQIARILGLEVETTSSGQNLALCRDLGATRAWDYASGSLAQAKPHFDVVFDIFGDLQFEDVRSWLEPQGVFVSSIATPGRVVRDVLLRFRPVRERFVAVRARRADLEQIATWLKSGELKAVIDSVFPADRVHEAFRRLESKRARGKVVVQI